jgi:hypothetical protein
MKVPEQYRDSTHPILGSDKSYGNNGFFVIPHPAVKDYLFTCMVSDGEGWQHVSVTLHKLISKNRYQVVKRTPTWGEMCFVKSQFWEPGEAVMQLHPVSEDYINMHEYCLHLWRPLKAEIPLPPAIMVGPIR